MFLQHQASGTSEVQREREENIPVIYYLMTYLKFIVSIYNVIQAIICAWMLIFSPLSNTNVQLSPFFMQLMINFNVFMGL